MIVLYHDLMIIIIYLMSCYDYCDFLILHQLHCRSVCELQLQAWPLFSRCQDIRQFLMKFVAQLTYHIDNIIVIAFTCGFQDVVSSADLKQ